MVFTALFLVSDEQCRQVLSCLLHEVVEAVHRSHRPQASQGMEHVLLILAIKKEFPSGLIIFDENPHVGEHHTEHCRRHLFESVG